MQTDYNALYWKSKAVDRNAEIKELKKRIKELSRSRNSWKEKYKEKKIIAEKYQNDIEIIKKKIEKILSI